MAFSRTGWNPIGGQSKKGVAPQLFTYTTTDAVGTIDASGYFNDISDDVSVGDVIISVTSTGGTLASSIHTVVSNASGVVDISDGTSISQLSANSSEAYHRLYNFSFSICGGMREYSS